MKAVVRFPGHELTPNLYLGHSFCQINRPAKKRSSQNMCKNMNQTNLTDLTVIAHPNYYL